jgi:excisionase family DNA binding protein
MESNENRGVPRFGLSPEETAEATSLSRTKVFELIRKGELTARKAGKSTIIEPAEVVRYLRSLPVRGRNPQAA